MKQLGFFVAISIIFHFLLTTSTLYFAEHFPYSSNRNKLTQIEILDQRDQPKDSPKDSLTSKLEKTRQMIKQLKATVQEIKDSKALARFESERTQRFEKETKARNLGVSQNSAPQPPTQQMKTASEKMKSEELSELTRANPSIQNSTVTQKSAISISLPSDISDSNATNLNTDASIYYSFYSRVEELFYTRWVERVRYYWERINFDYKRNVLSGKIWATSVEVWLTATGEYHSSYILKSSGYKAFDEAAVFAFKEARFFPNPPKAKVESDGFVRLRYRFNVHVPEYSSN